MRRTIRALPRRWKTAANNAVAIDSPQPTVGSFVERLGLAPRAEAMSHAARVAEERSAAFSAEAALAAAR